MLSAIKMKHILVYISFSLFYYHSYSQVTYIDDKGKSYRIDKIVSDYVIGVVLCYLKAINTQTRVNI